MIHDDVDDDAGYATDNTVTDHEVDTEDNESVRWYMRMLIIVNFNNNYCTSIFLIYTCFTIQIDVWRKCYIKYQHNISPQSNTIIHI